MKYIILLLLSLNIYSESLTLSLVEDIPKDVKDFSFNLTHLNKDNYILGAKLTGTTLLIMNFDKDIRNFVSNHNSKTLDDVSPAFKKFGEFYPPLILWGLGTVLDNKKSTETGLYAAEASLMGLGVTFIGKNIFSRARPYMEEGPNSWNNKKFSDDYGALPSGHSTVSFATATVIAEMYKNKKGVPQLAYSLASLSALSRIYDDKHWASDVFLGSSIGYLTGKAFIKMKTKSDIYLGPEMNDNSLGIMFAGTLK